MRTNIIFITKTSIIISKYRTTTGNSGKLSSFRNFIVTIKLCQAMAK